MNKTTNKPTNKTLAATVGAACCAILLGVGTSPGFTERFEGMRLKAYLDPVGIPTVCAGETLGVTIDQRHTLAECKRMLELGLIRHAESVLKCAPYLQGKPFALAASVDHAFNFGVSAFCGSSMNKAFKANDYTTGCVRFNEGPTGKAQWVYAGGKPLPGLVKRAAARRELCERGL